MLILAGNTCVNLDQVIQFFIHANEEKKEYALVFLFNQAKEAQANSVIGFPDKESVEKAMFRILEANAEDKKAVSINLEEKKEETK